MSKMSSLIILVLLVSQIECGEILDTLADFKDGVLGFFGKSKCGCPCRNYYVPKCEITYVEQCNYEHYEQVCQQVPVPVPRQAKEIECQKCQKYLESVPITKYVKECSPVYDEKCHTDYHQHCKTETRCVMIYQTVCGPGEVAPVPDTGYGYNKHKRSPGGYGTEQHCESQPRQHCYPETKCHRTPDTQCIPVQKENCIKVPKEVFIQKERHQCLPFELSAEQVEAMHNYDPCAQYQTGYGAPHHPHPGHGYEAPVVPSYGIPNSHEAQHHHQVEPHVSHSSPQQFVSSPQIISDQQHQPSAQIRQVAPASQASSPFPALPELPSYNGPDPLSEIQDGLSNLFNVKRDITVDNSKSDNGKSDNPEAIPQQNPFLRSSRHFDNEGWIPLVMFQK